ncbi:MAG: 6-phosphofructokinase [Actinomycetaceae bacterium]|nr:6-phosphofructokinase [Actinomycetaceae bacterium]
MTGSTELSTTGTDLFAPDLRHCLEKAKGTKVGILTSGGDAPGMNATVRAVCRTALKLGATPFAIEEGWRGAVEGGSSIRQLGWSDVSSTLNKGGTVIGTARCPEFRTREGLRLAAKHLAKMGIDRLVVIGGDGSLSGTDEFRREWPSLLAELVESGDLEPEIVTQHPVLCITGLVGSIDNDLVGTDMTIGTDSALHRILSAIDEISSTAASHQRTFILEVMGRHCGYLPLMATIAGGCDYVFIPEMPPEDGWEDEFVQTLRDGRAAGRRESLVIVAEGALDRSGDPITAQRVATVFEEKTGESPRITILGHTQRGGTPSAYDRWMPSVLGYAAAIEVLSADAHSPAYILGTRRNRITRLPLVETIARTRKIKTLMEEGNYEDAVSARGESFVKMLGINRTMSRPPSQVANAPVRARVGILHAGGLAPGMNAAARAVVRAGIDRHFEMVGIYGSFQGLIDGQMRVLNWKDVEGWGLSGGAELGTRRHIPETDELYAIGRAIENNHLDALVIIGGINGYLAARRIVDERDRYPAFRLPIVLVPATIDNNLPGSELSIGADTALNNALWALDRIKESAAASTRCFVAETMGRYCGYLALMSAIAAGAEQVYLNEIPTNLSTIAKDTALMTQSFREGRRLFLVVRNEQAGGEYNLDFLKRVFEQEGGNLFDVRASTIGHLQQGGAPSPFDRILATRMGFRAIDQVDLALCEGDGRAVYLCSAASHITTQDVSKMGEEFDMTARRPKKQWWLDYLPLVPVVSLEEGDSPVVPLPVVDADVAVEVLANEPTQ